MFNTVAASRLGVTKRLVSLFISVALHSLVLAVLVVIPLVFFNVLPEWELLTLLIADPAPPLPPPPQPPQYMLKPVAWRPVPIEHIIFRAPEEIPNGIPAPETDVPPLMVLSLPLSIGQAGVQPGMLGHQIEALNLLKAEAPAVLSPPPPPVRPKPVPTGGDVLQSRLIRKVVPDYPELAKRARVSGTVILKVSVDEEGNVYDVIVLRGHPLLEQAAVAAVRQWKYSPTLLNGEPVPVIAEVTVVFALR